MALASGPGNLDPRFATDASSERINRLLYARLTKLDGSGLPLPAMTDWQKLAPQHYRFTLRKNLKTYTNGAEPSVDDIVASYRYVLDDSNLSPHRKAISLIESVTKIDEQTVDFKLKYADPLFPAYLSLAILPANLIKDGHDFKKQPVGSGNFQFIEKQGQHHLLLKRRSDKQLLRFIEVKDPTVRVLKLLNNEADLIQNNVSPEISDYLRKKSFIHSENKPGSNFTYIGFNLQDKVTGNHLIRQAIACAVNRQDIIDHVFYQNARLAESILPASHWAGNKDLPRLCFDQNKARKLLQKAGYDSAHPLTISYKTSSDPFRIKLATVLQSQLKQVGIHLKISSYDWGTFFGDIKSGNFQMYSLSWVGIKTPDIFAYVFDSQSLPPSGANRGRYRSEKVDNLLSKVKQSSTLSEQKALFQALQQQVHDDLPYIPLWYENQQSFMNERISGYHVSSDGNFDALNNVRLR